MVGWLKFYKRVRQFFLLFNLPRIIHIYSWMTVVFWPFELVVGILHILGLGHFIQFILQSRKTRKLTSHECEIARSMFGDLIDLDAVRLNPISRIAERMNIAFVTANQVNFNTVMSDALLIHELTHIYQYQQVGLVYIPRCLKAQTSKAGYDFGAIEDHYDILNGQAGLWKLNYEQQAEFLESLYVSRQTNTLLAGVNSSFNSLNFTV